MLFRSSLTAQPITAPHRERERAGGKEREREREGKRERERERERAGGKERERERERVLIDRCISYTNTVAQQPAVECID